MLLSSRFDMEKEEDEVIIQLSQQDCRSRVVDQRELRVIGFHIMRVEANRKYRLHKIQESPHDLSSDYIKTKHIFLKTTLPRGRYVLVPTTFHAGETTDFLLRMFTNETSDMKLLEKDHPEPVWWKCCTAQPVVMTRVTVKSARSLEKQDRFGGRIDADKRLLFS